LPLVEVTTQRAVLGFTPDSVVLSYGDDRAAVVLANEITHQRKKFRQACTVASAASRGVEEALLGVA